MGLFKQREDSLENLNGVFEGRWYLSGHSLKRWLNSVMNKIDR